MAYSVITSDGITISVGDEDKDSSTLPLTLIGRNAQNYGQGIFTNTVRQLENFAGNTPPAASDDLNISGGYLAGQLWYNKSENTLRVFDGAEWARTSVVPVATTAITANIVAGTSYFNSTEDKLKVHDGAVFRDAVVPGGTVTSAYTGNAAASGSASNYGAKVETLFLQTTGSPSVVPVVALKYISDGSAPGDLADSAHDSAGATVMAIFSDTAFTLASSDPHYATLNTTDSFSAAFTRGMNLRASYTDSSVALAGSSEWADKANAIYTGITIPASDIITNRDGYIPLAGSTRVLGNATNRFSELHVDSIQLGHVSQAKNLGIVGTVNIGNASNRVNSLFVHDLSISGDLDFANVNTLTGLEDATITNVALTTGTISTLASDNTDIVNKQYVTNALITESLVAGKLALVPSSATNSVHYPLFADSATGNEQARTDTGFTYNPNSGVLSTTQLSATTISDGTASLSSGDLTGATTGNFSGTVTANLFSGALSGTSAGTHTGPVIGDVTGSLSGTTVTASGAVSGSSVTASGAVSGASITDGTATLASGALSGATTGNFSGTLTANLFSGTATAARYADLAEKYTADADYTPGTVVRIGGEAELTQTTGHADTEVFGVISTNPAYLMNKDIDGLPVALQGRVPVKVIGRVQKGERLISSDVPGVAEGVADREVSLQAIIGRALENKSDDDERVIEAIIGVK